MEGAPPSPLVAYVDASASGASGNMLLGALVDAGLDLGSWLRGMAGLGLEGWSLRLERREEGVVAGTFLEVELEGGGGHAGRGHPHGGPGSLPHGCHGHHPRRGLAEVERLIGGSGLSPLVRSRSIAVFRRLARAEAEAHGCAVGEVAFHEVGAVDSLVDTVGFVLGLEHLGVGALHASPLALGSGTVRCAHGALEVPVPAVRAVLAASGAPTVGRAEAGCELLTPTGASLLAELAVFSRPEMTVERTGRGFGSRRLPWANAVRVELGRLTARSAPGPCPSYRGRGR
jgi:uncharacterized protein (DUF111 family)